MDEDHNAGNCAKKVCDEHDNVHSGEWLIQYTEIVWKQNFTSCLY